MTMEKERKVLSQSRNEILQKISGLSEIWPRMTPLERRQIVHQTISRITLKDNQLSIDYKINSNKGLTR